jgi:hypothetical protein
MIFQINPRFGCGAFELMLKNEIYHISLVFSKLTLVIVSEISVIVVP